MLDALQFLGPQYSFVLAGLALVCLTVVLVCAIRQRHATKRARLEAELLEQLIASGASPDDVLRFARRNRIVGAHTIPEVLDRFGRRAGPAAAESQH